VWLASRGGVEVREIAVNVQRSGLVGALLLQVQVLPALAESHLLGGVSLHLAVLTHHPVQGSLDLLLTVVRVEQQSGLHRDLSSILLDKIAATATILIPPQLLPVVRTPEVQLTERDPVRIEVGGQGRDVTNIGVIHQGAEGDRSSVEIVQDLGSSP